MGNYIGKSEKRVEDPRFIQGKGNYVANLSMPDMAHVAVLRSPHAHANIKSINTDAAKAMEGVIDVFVGQDLIDGGVGQMPVIWQVPENKIPVRWPLTPDKVRHVGDSIAAVVAEDAYIARDALDLIEVDYEVLPATTGAEATTEDGKPLVHDEIENNTSFKWGLGDKEACDKAFEEADHVIEVDIANQRLIPNAMEPRACAAQWTASTEEMTVWTTSQNPHIIRFGLSAVTLPEIPEHKLRVISPDVGGGFGSKIFHYPEEIILPWVAKRVNRPVKWVATRSESFMTDSQGRDHVQHCKMAVTKDGIITGLHVELYADMGAYLSSIAPLIPTVICITLFSGLYKIPGIWGHTTGTLTNTVPVDAYRGAGRPEASFLVERLVDMAARELGMDPVEFRRKNFIPKDEFPYQTPVAFLYDSGDYHAMMDKAEENAGYSDMRKAQEEARKEGRLVGVGVSGCVEASGYGPAATVGALGFYGGMWEHGSIRVHPTGRVTVFSGSHSHGQGHETTFAQIVADKLGVDVADVDVVHGDTDLVTQGMGTYGSRSVAVGGEALVNAATEIRKKLVELAAHLLEASVDDMIYDDENGKVHVKGVEDKAKTFGELAFAAYSGHSLPEGMDPGLEHAAYYNPGNFTFPCSAHIVQVEVDKDTGEIAIQRYVAIEDCGNVINPMVVEGQIIGGIVQGVGQALYEHGIYDESGQLVTGSMLDYAMPRADNLPMIESDRTETPSPSNSLGVKGVGEMGSISSPPAIVNAVVDALADYGVKHIDMPLTSEKIWNIINSNGG